MKEIDDKSIDMIFADLPYQKTKNKWDFVIPPDLLWEQYERIIKDNGAIILFGQDKFTAKMMLSNEKLHRYNIIWDKVLTSGFLNAAKMPLRSHEDIMVFYKKLPTYNPQFWEGKPLHGMGKKYQEGNLDNNNYGDFASDKNPSANREGDTKKCPISILKFPKPHPSVALHPTQKPIDLCRYIIRTYSNVGDLVLDNCCGSGSIPLAAKLEDRNYIGMDNGVCEKKNSKYNGWYWSDIARDRIENYKETQ